MTASTPSGQLASITPPKDDAVFAALIAAAQRRLVELEADTEAVIPVAGSAISIGVGNEKPGDKELWRVWVYEGGKLTLVSDDYDGPDPAPSVEPDETCEPSPQPITESLMRAAQVGWVVTQRLKASGLLNHGVVKQIHNAGLWIAFGPQWSFYAFSDGGRCSTSDRHIVSLAPPAVVEGVAEVPL